MVEPTRDWPRTGSLQDRWPRVPADRDEADRFATEYNIGLRSVLRGGDGPKRCDELARGESSVTVEFDATELISGRVYTVAGISVVLDSPNFRWEFTIPTHQEYEDPVPLARRYLDERSRVRLSNPR